MQKYLLNFILSSLFFLISISGITAQNDRALLEQLYEEDREAIEALILYPKETRMEILEISKYPQALIKLDRIQKKSSAQFKALLESSSKETQQAIWDLTRYPNLVKRLVVEGQGKKKRIESVLKKYPSVVQQRARKIGEDNYELLKQVHQLERSTAKASEIVMLFYPDNIQTALRSLVELPEVLSVLTENIQLTILVGDVYQKDPKWIISQSDSLSQVLSQQQAEELAAWQENLENNPEALQELQASVEEFSEEYGYDDLYYDATEDDLYYYEEEEEDSYDYNASRTIEKHYYHHYPYWYGYPDWYHSPRWRPYPVWWDWGFYINPHRVTIFFRLPSFHFTNWYFYRPHHHYYYPHLTNQFIDHYLVHRNRTSSIHVTVNSWRTQNRTIINENWISNKRDRVTKIREFGRFEANRQNYNRDHPTRKINQAEYLRKNSPRYPRLKQPATKESVDKRRRENPRTTKKPIVQPTDTKRPKTSIRKYPSSTKKNRTNSIRKIDRAKDYHKGNWDKAKRNIRKPSVSKRSSSKRSKTKVIRKNRSNNEE